VGGGGGGLWVCVGGGLGGGGGGGWVCGGVGGGGGGGGSWRKKVCPAWARLALLYQKRELTVGGKRPLWEGKKSWLRGPNPSLMEKGGES